MKDLTGRIPSSNPRRPVRSVKFNEKPQGETRLRWYVIAMECLHETDRRTLPLHYISPMGGALNIRWVADMMDFIFSCLLSKNKITKV
jgi:hypothetical protein